MTSLLQQVRDQLTQANQINDPGIGDQGTLLIVRRTVEQFISTSFPVSAVLEVTIRLSPVNDGEAPLSEAEKKNIHVVLQNEVEAAIDAGTQMRFGQAPVVQKVILFARTLPGKKHYITSDPSTDFVKAAYLKMIFHTLQTQWTQRANNGNLVHPRLSGATVDFILTRPLDYVNIQHI